MTSEVKYGDIFEGFTQTIDVNVWAEMVNPEKWNYTSDVVINYGDKWYYGVLPYKNKTESDQYLIHDCVGSDGWGDVYIYKDIKTIGHKPNTNLPIKRKLGW